MLVHRTKEKKVFWEFGSIIMQNMSHNLLLFCAPTWPSYHVIENHLFSSFVLFCCYLYSSIVGPHQHMAANYKPTHKIKYYYYYHYYYYYYYYDLQLLFLSELGQEPINRSLPLLYKPSESTFARIFLFLEHCGWVDSSALFRMPNQNKAACLPHMKWSRRKVTVMAGRSEDSSSDEFCERFSR